jgi:predicted DNA-binding transcriptional regulator AlpA
MADPPRKKYIREKAVLARGDAPSRTTLRRWILEGRFPKPIKLGPSTTVFDVDELDAHAARLKAEREAASTPPPAPDASPDPLAVAAATERAFRQLVDEVGLDAIPADLRAAFVSAAPSPDQRSSGRR